MNRITNILNNSNFIEAMKKNEECEMNREFCKHNLQHCLDVARISYILNMECRLGISKEVIYAASLLHDIGRWKQYKNGTPHEEASAAISREVLEQCEFNNDEIVDIISAILDHRKKTSNCSGLSSLLYKADKLSRNCFLCGAYRRCNWPEDKKNKTIFV